MRRRSRPYNDDDSPEEPLINLTPLIDVVFVVLITFMLVAPALDIDPIVLAYGSSAKKEETVFQNSPLAISVQADNSIWFRNKKVSLSELEASLKQERKKQPRAIPQVLHDYRAQFGTYQAVKNTLESAGFEQMDVILKPN